ncbi:riboflavin synthase [Staphylococcus caledonicus]|uniref:riboflavin synthase n=1 Tax=Staphylococcus caledonicus TaxID=2741333 RepID=UPI0018E4C71C|nr:riboflavin synthase [Staphylococcus caledonicus]MBI5972803.1 riboflavin synthase [Staphylococcus caledonicus]
MFTGIVEEIGTVKNIRTQQSVRTLDIACHKILEDMQIGDSISVNGACLTVINFQDTYFTVQVIKGTEDKTYLSQIKQHDEVNLERAMAGNGRFGGHFVLGHVDQKGVVSHINETPNSRIVTIKAPDTIIKQLVKQGSITVDGVSLTVFDLHSNSFDIHLIPETRRSTILSAKKIGDNVHLETDVLFKYVETILNRNDTELTVDKLKAFGF